MRVGKPPSSGTEPPAASAALPPNLLAEAARRLSWIWVAIAVIFVATFVLQRVAQPEMAGVLDDPAVRLVLLANVLIAIGLVALQRQKLVPAQTLLAFGMVFEVIVAFTIALVETAVPFEREALLRGISSVGPWIFAMGVIVPNRPSRTLATALIAATAWPAAYAVNAARFGAFAVPTIRVVVWMFANYGMAVLAYLVGRRIFGSEVAMHKADDLGSYHLVAPIAQGGMGEVWKATHKMLAREAAVKLVRKGMIAEVSARQAEIAVKRFQREAHVTAGLQSPHTVYLYDFGLSEDGHFFYAMEMLDGITLQTLVTKFGPQPVPRVVAILHQVCESLEEAHQKGLVHRDLKPSNVMICKVALEYDFVKVLDFGLVKPLDIDGQSRLTLDGVFGGTVGYIAPEVALGDHRIDGRADLYAVGCIAYFLLTGTQVFSDSTPAAIALRHVNAQPDPPSRRTELPIPPEIDRLVLQCLAKTPDQRPPNARALADLLDACRVPAWTAADAERWWQLNLPPSSVLRSGAQTSSATPSSLRKI